MDKTRSQNGDWDHGGGRGIGSGADKIFSVGEVGEKCQRCKGGGGRLVRIFRWLRVGVKRGWFEYGGRNGTIRMVSEKGKKKKRRFRLGVAIWI